MNRLIIGLLLISSVVFAKENYIIHVKGMHCPLCTAMVRKALLKVDGVVSAKASLKDKNARVEVEDRVTKKELLEAIKTTGYTGEFIK